MSPPQPPGGQSVDLQNASRPHVPDYHLLRQIGGGSYGEVWLARSLTGAYRAVKVIYRKTFEEDRPYEREFRGIEKFEPISRMHESQLDVLHVGRNDHDGYFYYVMELADDLNDVPPHVNWNAYVPHTLKNELARSGPVAFAECVELGVRLATALDHLHQHGLVHRDVKPSNTIFVSGTPKLADIGLVAGQDDSISIVGTIGYFPLEGPGTPQADVYGLGKVLYEAATGKDRRDFPDLPTQLNARAGVAQQAELNEIILKACARDPRQRYQSALELKADLLLLQSGKSVKRIRKLEKRLQLLTRVGAASLFLAVLAVAILFFEHRQSNKILSLANESRERLVRNNVSQGTQELEAGDYLRSLLWFTKALELDQNDPTRASIDRVRIEAVRRQCPKLVAFGIHNEPILDAEFSPDGRWILTASQDGTARLWDIAGSDTLAQPLKHDGPVRKAVFSPNGVMVATASDDFTAKIWEAATGGLVCTPLTHASNVVCVAFSPDSLKVVTSSMDHTARVWDARTGKGVTPFLKHSDIIDWVAFSPDGRLVATASRDHTTQLWNADSGEPVIPPLKHDADINQTVFRSDGRRVLTVSDDGTGRVWDVHTGEPKTPLLRQRGRIQRATFSPNGKRLVTAGGLPGGVGLVQIWNAETGELILALPQQESEVFNVCFSPNGRWLLLGCSHGAVTVWDTETGERVCPILRHSQRVTAAAFASDGRRILTAGKDGTWRIWDQADDWARSPSMEFPHTIWNAEFDPFGRRILAAERSKEGRDPTPNRAYVIDASGPWRSNLFVQHGAPILHAEFSPDGRSFLTTSWDFTLRVWDTSDGHPISPILQWGAWPWVNSMVIFSKAGDMILGGDGGDQAGLFVTRTWTRETPALKHSGSVLTGAFSPDGSRVATGTGELDVQRWGAVSVWDTKTGRLMYPPLKHKGWVLSVRFAPDGKRLLSAWSPPGEAPGGAELWDVQSGQHLFSLPHADGVQAAEFSPDGRRLVTGSEDRTARIWDASSGTPVGQVMPHRRTVHTASFSPDGRKVVTGSSDGTVRVWDAATGEPLTPPSPCGGMVWSARFSPQADRILAGSGDWNSTGQLHVWEIPEIHYATDEITELAQLMSGSGIDRTGTLVPLSTKELNNRWRTLRRTHSEDFSVNPTAIDSWQRNVKRRH